MNRRKYLQTAGAVGTGLLTGLAGCAGSGGEWERTIAINTPQTGPIGFIGESIIQGSEVAIEEFNQQNDGEDISLTIADTAGEVEEARSVTQEAIEDGAVAITGTISSDVAVSIRELLESEEVPHLTPIAGEPAITQDGTDFSFRLPGSETQKEFGMLQFFEEQGVEDVAIIGADYSYPRTTVEEFERFAPDFGISIESASFVPLGTDNFRPELDFNNEDVDAIFLPYPGANGVTLIQQIREEGLFEDNIIVGDYGYGSVPYLSALQEDIVGVNNWGADLTSDRSQQVVSAVDGQFDTRAAIYHLLGYDSVMTIARSISQADSLDPVAVRDMMREIDYNAASGWRVTFGENGDCETYRMVINEWIQQDDRIVNERRFRSDEISSSPSP